MLSDTSQSQRQILCESTHMRIFLYLCYTTTQSVVGRICEYGGTVDTAGCKGIYGFQVCGSLVSLASLSFKGQMCIQFS